MIIGILSLQGAFTEHIHMFKRIGVTAVEIRLPSELEKLDGLVIPGGESTTMMKLMHSYDFVHPIRHLSSAGIPVWGTCAGLICLANDVCNPDSTPMDTLGLMKITVERNAFGRQVDSFETSLQIDKLRNGPFPGVFIRAPYIKKAGKGVDVLCSLSENKIVAARQDNLLATAFHPELTDDPRLHSYFAGMINRRA